MNRKGLIGHRRVLDLLEEEAASAAHAYMFVGPEGVGKAMIALRFAAVILCDRSGRHDGPCSVCDRVASGNHPDVTVVVPDGRASIGVEQARTAVHAASMTPVEGERKIILIDEASILTESAANALLKTIEEPSPSTVFILVAESEDDLPPTIASRCRTVHFGRVRMEELIEGLELAGVAAEQAQRVAVISGGRPGLALQLATEKEVVEFRQFWLTVPERVTPHTGNSFLLADAAERAAAPLIKTLGVVDPNETKIQKERRERSVKRSAQALMITGLEILASWYTDAAAAQFGVAVRNSDVDVTRLAMITPAEATQNAELALDAVTAIRQNQRVPLVLANLFNELARE